MHRLQLFTFSLVFLFTVNISWGQDLDLLEDDEEQTIPVSATFKANRIINGHSVEMVKKREFDFKISHRFGFVNRGFYDLFGLDMATIRVGGDFGITDRINVGIGRSTVEKTYDAFAKIKLLEQSTGAKSKPVSIVGISHMGINTLRWPNPNRENFFSSRLHYTHQLLIARKMSDGFSAQLSANMVHLNLVDSMKFSNDIFSVGLGLRQKLTNRVTLNLEYFHTLTSAINPLSTNALSIGFDVETGGHVFQLFFTNASAPYEKGFLSDTRGQWSNGDVRFGFNVTRMFSF
ncbi:MAG: hypothetical protein JXR19_06890 [Bacteroidia bacterium]